MTVLACSTTPAPLFRNKDTLRCAPPVDTATSPVMAPGPGPACSLSVNTRSPTSAAAPGNKRTGASAGAAYAERFSTTSVYVPGRS